MSVAKPYPNFGPALAHVLALLNQSHAATAEQLTADWLQEREQPAAEPQLSLLKEPYGSLVE